jgi:hypothetical protein
MVGQILVIRRVCRSLGSRSPTWILFTSFLNKKLINTSVPEAEDSHRRHAITSSLKEKTNFKN